MGKIEGKSYNDKHTPSSREKVILNKVVYNNKELNDNINRDFTSLIRTQPPVTV